MKQKLKERLSEMPNDFLLEILESLCERDKTLENEIEFILSPAKIKRHQSYYNRFVKAAIDTNSWSHFPNKGVTGLLKCLEKMKLLNNAKNYTEAEKMGISILGIISRCQKKYNNQNKEELDKILNSLDI